MNAADCASEIAKAPSLMCGDCREVMAAMPADSVDTIITDPPYGLSFMGKDWDQSVPGPDYWRAALRVAKPGALLLAFGGTRTFHRLTCAIEDAGWEVRDCLSWLYGSGFPKSLDIAKAIDRKRDDRADVLRVTAFVRAARDAAGVTNATIDDAFGTHGMAGHWTSTATQPAVPTWEQWAKLREILAMGDRMDAEVWRLNGRKGTPGHERTDRVTTAAGESGSMSGGRVNVLDAGAPATEAAKTWHGWGTALKPAWEPIILAMKPLDGTFAENAQRHGVAGLAIDAGRIGTDSTRRDTGGAAVWGQAGRIVGGSDCGRWPANVLLDEVAAAGEEWSRFFYCAKASRSERGEGNDHPTVKPLALMRYLCRLTKTPTGGVVLDPFAGSGSTGVAAVLEGRPFVGIELDPHNAQIAVGRLAAALGGAE